VLWEHASRSLRDGVHEPQALNLGDGAGMWITTEPLHVGGQASGAVLTIKPMTSVRSEEGHPSTTPVAATLPGLLGECPRWRALCASAARLPHNSARVLVVGETGSGRAAVAVALVARHQYGRWTAATPPPRDLLARRRGTEVD